MGHEEREEWSRCVGGVILMCCIAQLRDTWDWFNCTKLENHLGLQSQSEPADSGIGFYLRTSWRLRATGALSPVAVTVLTSSFTRRRACIIGQISSSSRAPTHFLLLSSRRVLLQLGSCGPQKSSLFLYVCAPNLFPSHKQNKKTELFYFSWHCNNFRPRFKLKGQHAFLLKKKKKN